MDTATEMAIATIVGALRKSRSLSAADIAEMAGTLSEYAENNAGHTGQSLASLAKRIGEEAG